MASHPLACSAGKDFLVEFLRLTDALAVPAEGMFGAVLCVCGEAVVREITKFYGPTEPSAGSTCVSMSATSLDFVNESKNRSIRIPFEQMAKTDVDFDPESKALSPLRFIVQKQEKQVSELTEEERKLTRRTYADFTLNEEMQAHLLVQKGVLRPLVIFMIIPQPGISFINVRDMVLRFLFVGAHLRRVNAVCNCAFDYTGPCRTHVIPANPLIGDLVKLTDECKAEQVSVDESKRLREEYKELLSQVSRRVRIVADLPDAKTREACHLFPYADGDFVSVILDPKKDVLLLFYEDTRPVSRYVRAGWHWFTEAPDGRHVPTALNAFLPERGAARFENASRSESESWLRDLPSLFVWRIAQAGVRQSSSIEHLKRLCANFASSVGPFLLRASPGAALFPFAIVVPNIDPVSNIDAYCACVRGWNDPKQCHHEFAFESPLMVVTTLDQPCWNKMRKGLAKPRSLSWQPVLTIVPQSPRVLITIDAVAGFAATVIDVFIPIPFSHSVPLVEMATTEADIFMLPNAVPHFPLLAEAVEDLKTLPAAADTDIEIIQLRQFVMDPNQAFNVAIERAERKYGWKSHVHADRRRRMFNPVVATRPRSHDPPGSHSPAIKPSIFAECLEPEEERPYYREALGRMSKDGFVAVPGSHAPMAPFYALSARNASSIFEPIFYQNTVANWVAAAATATQVDE